MQQNNENQYFKLPVDKLKQELKEKNISYRKAARRTRYKSAGTISSMLNDDDNLSPEAKEKCRRKVCNLLARIDRKRSA